MEGIQHNLHCRNVHFFHELLRFRTGIKQISFKTVQNLKTVFHAAFSRNLTNCTHIGNTSCPVPRLINRLGIIHRPVGINTTANRMDIENFQLFQNIGIKCNRILNYLRITAAKVLFRIRSISGRQRNSRIFCHLFHFKQLVLSDIFQHRTGDFQNIKTQILHLGNVLLLIDIPLLLPVCKINSIFHFIHFPPCIYFYCCIISQSDTCIALNPVSYTSLIIWKISTLGR